MVWTDDRNLARVAEFHYVFGLLVQQWPEITSEVHERSDFRIELIREELEELIEGVTGKKVKVKIEFLTGKQTEPHGLVPILDALCDLQYVIDGMFLTYGLHKVKEAAMHEVHKSNMTKLDHKGKPIIREDGKILKSQLFRLPRLSDVVENYQMFGD